MSGGETPIRVAVVDDHEMVREGLRVLLDTAPDIETVGEAGTVGRAIAMLKELRPDVALVDIRLPDGSGIDVCRAVTGDPPGVRCLILTSVSHDEAARQAMTAGASGFVLKQIRGPELLASIRKVAAGESLLERDPIPF